MLVERNISLKPYNSFGIDVAASHWVALRHEEELAAIGNDVSLPEERLVLGGGSNILFRKNVEALVIKNNLKGREVVDENEAHVWMKVKAGEVWHDWVMYAIDHHLGGIENLALIPGCVGASPMQNIGAYGVEVKDVIEEVECWHWEEKRRMVMRNEECRFGYRDSIFKHELKGKVLITSVVFRLDKQHKIQTSYGAIQQQLQRMGVSEPSIKSVANAVIAIRQSKLPDPAKIGNAGSFFKNPTISQKQFENIRVHHPDIPSYPSKDAVKIPAGWLIEHCGWKGYRDGDAGVHTLQALVLVNYGHATGDDIFHLSEKIIDSVKEKFGIELEREVNIW
jgi:UDP-N-acetylmuramate dehydrogenase